MAFDPRLQVLLERYPLELTDEELAELRAAAELDPAVDAHMARMHEVDAALTGLPAGPPPPLSASARARLDALLVAEGVSPLPAEGAPTVRPVAPADWAADPEVPLLDSAAAPAPVVDFAAARRRLRPAEVALSALAAILVVGLTLLLAPRGPEFGEKGASSAEAPMGTLFVQDEAGTRVRDQSARPVDQPVTFRAVVAQPGHAALLETQGGRTFVLYPAPGDSWPVNPGSNLLSAGAGAAYRPGREGRAVYHLVLSPDPPPIPPDREVASPEAFVTAAPGAATRAVLGIDWTAR